MRMPAARFAAAYREVQNAPNAETQNSPLVGAGCFCTSAQSRGAQRTAAPGHRTNPRWCYPSGVRRLAAQARSIRTEAGLAPSGSPAAQFHSAAASFLPEHRTNPRLQAAWGSSACCASACHGNRGGPCPLELPRCSIPQRSSITPSQYRTNPRRQAAWGSFNREENMRREKLAN